MVDAQIILDTRRKTKKGYPVKIRVYSKTYRYIPLRVYSDTTRLKFTPFLTKRAAQLVEEVEYCNTNKLNLEQSLNIIKNGIDKSRDHKVFLLKQKLKELQKGAGIGILEFYDIRIQEKKEIGESVRAYEGCRSQFKNFLVNDISLNDITYEWLTGFILHKKKTGCNDGGISTYLRNLRALYKEAQKRESLNIKKENPFTGLIKNSSTKNITKISVKEIRKLFSYVPKLGTTKTNVFKIKRNIDIWLFQLAIGGHDYADIANLQWESIIDNRIKIKRYKNRNKPNGGVLIDNKLNNFAQSVIHAYGDTNNKKVFSFIPYPYQEKKYHDFRTNINRSLGFVSEDLKLSSNLKSKTPRYLFRSLAGELLIDFLVIMQLQGHTSGNVTFGYQRDLPYEIIDREHQKVLNLIFN